MDKSSFDKSYDFVMIRHPKVGVDLVNKPGEDDWIGIFSNSIDALRPEGVLFVTTFLYQERDKVLDIIERNGHITIESIVSNDPINAQNLSDSFSVLGRKI